MFFQVLLKLSSYLSGLFSNWDKGGACHFLQLSQALLLGGSGTLDPRSQVHHHYKITLIHWWQTITW